jgi:hypothetical protein
MRVVTTHAAMPSEHGRGHDAQHGPIMEPPRPLTRSEVAAHLGMAADAIGAALRRWQERPYQATGGMLQRAEIELDFALLGIDRFAQASPVTISSVLQAHDGVYMLSRNYLRNLVPHEHVPFMLAQYTYDIRQAQALLLGVRNAASFAMSGYTA